MPRILADAIFWIAVAACSIAQIAIVRSVLISPTGSTSSGRRASEIAWAILPGVALVALFFYTWQAMHGPAINAGVVAALLK
jgi:heme/copper-type cytochrome/quinol oxidase subunit 2